MRTSALIGLVPPSRLKFALLQDAQELDLRRGAHLADLVEQQHAAGSGLDLSGAALIGAGERAALVAEELGFEQRFRQRRAVHRCERTVPARRRAVDVARDYFLAGARFAGQQDRGVRFGNLRRRAHDVLPRRGLTRDSAITGARLELGGQRLDARLEPSGTGAGRRGSTRGLGQLFVRNAKGDMHRDVTRQGDVGLAECGDSPRPEVQREELLARAHRHREDRAVAGGLGAFAIVGWIEGRRRLFRHEVVDDLGPHIAHRLEVRARRPHEKWPVIIRERIGDERAAPIVQRHREAVVRQEALHDRRDFGKHLADVEDRPHRVQQFLRNLEGQTLHGLSASLPQVCAGAHLRLRDTLLPLIYSSQSGRQAPSL